ncbi:thioredoxin family protein [Telluria aromaticivorans]|uniref:Thioredoxin family protein n=1 Tax=Telluria aromaticivorans TaxID=2725995 RepID=A0A7Y2JXA2_9BURK|nr:thioredoxin family protein [Telluria aromaticivorans]NNG21439.1 thioredoxin family protein [Telluria aromaticivorans]
MKRHIPAIAGSIAACALAALAVGASLDASTAAGRSVLQVEGKAPGFDGATTWLNSAPLGVAQLRGKVVLVNFWTYSCINCIRAMPYSRAWANKYRDQGLAVVGVHTPEFRFEQDLTNVNAAVGRFGIDFPVAVDSSHQIWRAWGNRYWPAYYLVDGAGRIRYHQFGEGDYDKMERAIQSLLAEQRGAALADTSLVDPKAGAEHMAPDAEQIASEETYVGYRKALNFRSPERVRPDAPQAYTVGRLGLNGWGLLGRWTVGPESAQALEAGAGIAYQFSARDLHLVLGPGAAGTKLRIRVTLDGKPPGADHGSDINAAGDGVIDATRLYQLVRQAGPARERRFEIRFLDRGAEAYAFTFG